MGTGRGWSLPPEVISEICQLLDDDIGSADRLSSLLHMGLCCKWLWTIAKPLILRRMHLTTRHQLDAAEDWARETADLPSVEELAVSVPAESWSGAREVCGAARRLLRLPALSRLRRVHLLIEFRSQLGECLMWLPKSVEDLTVVADIYRTPVLLPRYDHCQQLRTLNLRLDRPHYGHLLDFTKRTPLLQDLTIELGRSFDENWSALCEVIAPVAPSLRSLTLRVPPATTSVVEEGFSWSTGQCEQLQKLTVSGVDLAERLLLHLPVTIERIDMTFRHLDWECLYKRIEGGHLPALKSLRSCQVMRPWHPDAIEACGKLPALCKRKGIALVDETPASAISTTNEVDAA